MQYAQLLNYTIQSTNLCGHVLLVHENELKHFSLPSWILNPPILLCLQTADPQPSSFLKLCLSSLIFLHYRSPSTPNIVRSWPFKTVSSPLFIHPTSFSKIQPATTHVQIPPANTILSPLDKTCSWSLQDMGQLRSTSCDPTQLLTTQLVMVFLKSKQFPMQIPTVHNIIKTNPHAHNATYFHLIAPTSNP